MSVQNSKDSASDAAIISIRDLSFCWSTEDAFKLQIDALSVSAGERLFIQGASGCGKSTLLSLLTGIVLPQSGSVEVLGHALQKKTALERDHFRADHIGYIFQQFNLVPYLSVLENVSLPCFFSERKRSRAIKDAGSVVAEAERLLEQLGMGGAACLKKAVGELSVGQQQRVAAARALMGSPELIIADEPTSALDSDNRENFIQLLFEECTREKASLVFVSHDRSLSGLFDRVHDLGGVK